MKPSRFIHIRILLAIAATIFFSSVVKSQDLQDYNPEVSARVARVKFLQGNALIFRKDASEWEKVVMNLPIVEGDEIVLENNARLEIQLDSWNFIRVDENTTFRMTTLTEEGVALSLFNGTISVRVGKMLGEGAFFEVDAPGSTIAIQKEGLYRFDATDSVNGRVRVSVSENGEARVYSDTSGFTLRSGRTATLFLVGARKGEWDLAEFRNSSDTFDRWVRTRDDYVARKLKGAYFDKYYDSDFYGADDLNDYGTWVETSEYGTVWRPYRTALSVYVNWSPYRYGHWRWVPPYGWTWVNDEPWGWVTYHHGRWVYISGYWHWAPYPHPSYRWTRSWWRPAFVSFYYYGGSVCWYPLSYYSVYYDYNSIYYSRWSDRNYARNSRWRQPNVTINIINVPRDYDRRNPRVPRERQQVPERGIVVMDKGEFGRSTNPGRIGNRDVSRRINSSPVIDSSPVLPDFNPKDRNGNSKIFVQDKPKAVREGLPRTGVGDRRDDKPVDPRLREKKIFGDRTPTQRPDSTMPVDESNPRQDRRPGAVTRPDRDVRPQNPTPERNPETVNPRTNTPRTETPRPTPTPRFESPRREPRPTPTPDQSPRYGTPRVTPTPDQSPRNEAPRPTPTPRFESPRREPRPTPTPRVESPRREPRPTPTPDQTPRYGTPRPTPTPDQSPRYETPSPRFESPRREQRPAPTPDQSPRYGTPRQAPTPDRSPRYEAPPPRNESPRPAPQPRQETPRVTVPPRSSEQPKSESPRPSQPNRKELPDRSQEKKPRERDD